MLRTVVLESTMASTRALLYSLAARMTSVRPRIRRCFELLDQVLAVSVVVEYFKVMRANELVEVLLRFFHVGDDGVVGCQDDFCGRNDQGAR